LIPKNGGGAKAPSPFWDIRMRRFLLVLVLGLVARPAAALDDAAVEKLAFGGSDDKVRRRQRARRGGRRKGAALLQASPMAPSRPRQTRADRDRDQGVDALTGEKISPLPEEREDVVVNNRLRREIDSALGSSSSYRPNAARGSRRSTRWRTAPTRRPCPSFRKAFRARDRSGDQARLELIAASIELASGDRATRLAAVRTLGRSGNPNTKTLLLSLAKKDGGGEADQRFRAAAEASLRAVEGRAPLGRPARALVAGISLGSILLLAALGLAITYGLMGVINMAHVS